VDDAGHVEAETAAVRPADEMDWERLATFLRGCLDLPAGPLEARQFTAGRANLTYLVDIAGVRVVVRRPPHGTLPPGAHDMAREAKVLTGLADVYPRAPKLLAFSDDVSIIGAPFLVTEYRSGTAIRDRVPVSMEHHPEVARRVDLALVDAVADLHAVDVDAAGLTDLGRPDGFADRQVSGWADRWRRAAPDDSLPVMDEVGEILAASVPTPAKVAIVHNDLKLDNCQFDADDPDHVTAVFDWDMATLGDPLFDLGLVITSMSSFPVWEISADEAGARYAERSGIGVDRLDWYLAFASWRTAVVLQQLYNRHVSGDSADQRLASLGAHIPGAAQRARSLLDQ